MLVVMCGRKTSKLGGQDRRWLKVSNILLNKYNATVVINDSYLQIARQTEFEISNSYIVLMDNCSKYINYIKMNFGVIKIGLCHSHLHYCAHALEMLPSALILKLIFNKKISFSFNGVSVEYLKSTKQNKSVLILNLMNSIAYSIELLNPRLLKENFFDKKKIFFSKPMYSGKPALIRPPREWKIVFSGHLYALKGVDLLLDIIESCPDKKYHFYIYGDVVSASAADAFLERIDKLKYNSNIRFVSHVNDMKEAYSDAAVVLSLQTISNYPSQVVMEGLAAGAAVVMTDVGDSREFGEIPGIFYINPNITHSEFWAVIESAAEFSKANRCLISKTCVEKFSAEVYAAEFYKNIKDGV